SLHGQRLAATFVGCWNGCILIVIIIVGMPCMPSAFLGRGVKCLPITGPLVRLARAHPQKRKKKEKSGRFGCPGVKAPANDDRQLSEGLTARLSFGPCHLDCCSLSWLCGRPICCLGPSR